MSIRYNETIENALHLWVKTETGITAVWDKQSVKRPSLPYALLNMSAPRLLNGITPETKVMDNGKIKTYYNYEVTLSVRVLADSQYLYYMNLLEQSTDVRSVYNGLSDQGIKYTRHDNANDLSDLLDSDYQFIVSQDYFFSFTMTREDEQNWMTALSLTMGYGDIERTSNINFIEE